MFYKQCDNKHPHETHEYVHHWDKLPEEPWGWFPPGSYHLMPDEGVDSVYRCRGVELEPDRDPITGSMIPCVVCGMSPQVAGTGCCSVECERDLEDWMERKSDV